MLVKEAPGYYRVLCKALQLQMLSTNHTLSSQRHPLFQPHKQPNIYCENLLKIYHVFNGTALCNLRETIPRSSFMRYWRNVLSFSPKWTPSSAVIFSQQINVFPSHLVWEGSLGEHQSRLPVATNRFWLLELFSLKSHWLNLNFLFDSVFLLSK